MEKLVADYNTVLAHHRACFNLNKSCESAGILARTFHRQRHIGELQIVDTEAFKEVYYKVIAHDLTLKQFDDLCRKKIQENSLRSRVAKLRIVGKLLPK